MSKTRGWAGFALPSRVSEEPQEIAKNLREIEDWLNKFASIIVPIGGIILFARPAVGDPPPDIFLRCNGQSVLRADYPVLFAQIGTAFGAPDSTHFNVPTIANVVTDVKYFIRAA